MSNKKLFLNNKSTVDSIREVGDGFLVIFDNQCIQEVNSDDLQKKLLETYSPEKITLYAKPITDALKKVNNEGYVIENIPREDYLELYTPLICKSEYIQNYFKKFDQWDLYNFIELHEGRIEFIIF